MAWSANQAATLASSCSSGMSIQSRTMIRAALPRTVTAQNRPASSAGRSAPSDHVPLRRTRSTSERTDSGSSTARVLARSNGWPPSIHQPSLLSP